MSILYKAILFDNDGTIVNTEECILLSIKYVMKEVLNDSDPDLEFFKTLIGLPIKDQLLNYSDDPQQIELMCNMYRSHNAKVIDDYSYNYKGLPEVLKEMKNMGCYMGIVTSKLHKVCVHGLEQLGLSDYFEYIQGSDDWHIHKPDPGALVYACQFLNLKPNEVLYVGDSIYDMKSAKGAGCSTCAVTWGCGKEDLLRKENPTYIINKPKELLDVIKGK